MMFNVQGSSGINRHYKEQVMTPANLGKNEVTIYTPTSRLNFAAAFVFTSTLPGQGHCVDWDMLL